eukprot:7895617-Lingulodinium_polyedra.AAC.1
MKQRRASPGTSDCKIAVWRSAATWSGIPSLASPPRKPTLDRSSQDRSPMRTHLRCTFGMACVQCVVSGKSAPVLAS